MLDQEEKKYLLTIPTNRIVTISSYDPVTEKIFNLIASKIRLEFPELEILHMGASGLRISGQDDVDIYMFSDLKHFSKYKPTLIKLFGVPQSEKSNSIEWKLIILNHEVELYLTDPNTESTFR